MTVDLDIASEMYVNALQSIAQPNTTLLHCTLHLNISMIQALYRAVQISASLGSVSEIHSTKETAYSYRRPST